MSVKVVLDTNVIISATLSPTGNCANIINMIAEGAAIQLFYSADMLAEYQEVLSREYLRVAVETQNLIVKTIKDFGVTVNPVTSDTCMPDESDRVFYDVAQEAGAMLITGNQKHYPVADFIVTPAEFLRFLHLSIK